jgi:sugar lactone lactonase YvrE
VNPTEPLARPANAGIYVLSEGPVWDAATSRVTWVDIEAGLLLSAELAETSGGPALGAVTQTQLGEHVGCAFPLDGGRALVALTRQLAVVEPDGTIRRGSVLLPEGQRFNDGKIDPQGRLVAGTLWLDGAGPADNRLIRLEHDGSVTTLDGDLQLSNGLGWSPDGTVFYSTDTPAGKIYRRSYGVDTVGPRQDFITFDDGVWPDGLTVDAGGNLWVAIWGGAEVRVYGPDGARRPELGLHIDAPHSSSVAFAGAALDVAVVTSASRDLTPQERSRHPAAGGLFLAQAPVRGLPATPWRPVQLP